MHGISNMKFLSLHGSWILMSSSLIKVNSSYFE
jgi:hypothetical protein